MTTAIISGREGTGKTTQVLAVAKAFPPVAWAVLELKDKAKIEKRRNDTFSTDTLYVTYPREHEKAKQVDPVSTLRNLITWKTAIVRGDYLPKTIVVDGISDIRDYAIEAWIIKHNEETGDHLTGIKYKDWGAYGEVNSTVREILEPLINLALEEDLNLFLTSQMKEDYVNDAKVGYKPDLKDWMSYPVQCLFTLYKAEKSSVYSLSCEKECMNASWQVDELEKDKGLLKALLSHDLLVVDSDTKRKLSAETKEYMLRVKDENGNSKRSFVNATSKEEAIAQAEQEGYEVLEVLE